MSARFSDDRLTHLAHLVHDRLYHEDLVDYPDEDKAIREIKRTLIDYFKVEEEIDTRVRERITSLKREVAEGGPEWEILYRKYFEEEMMRHGRD